MRQWHRDVIFGDWHHVTLPEGVTGPSYNTHDGTHSPKHHAIDLFNFHYPSEYGHLITADSLEEDAHPAAHVIREAVKQRETAYNPWWHVSHRFGRNPGNATNTYSVHHSPRDHTVTAETANHTYRARATPELLQRLKEHGLPE